MKFAYLVISELRSVHKTIQKLDKYIVDHFNADIYILCQHQFEDDEARVKCFTKNVKYVELYTKPDPFEFFQSSLLKINSDNNWNNPVCLQPYINICKLEPLIRKIMNQYDYFLILRTDIDILFDFPPPDLFEQVPPGAYAFDPVYCRWWGGLGGAHIIHSSYILRYVTAIWNILHEPNRQDILRHAILHESIFNAEKFIALAVELEGFQFSKIPTINYYYTATTLQDYTTWSKITTHPKYGVVCKYPEQCDEAYQALEKWNAGWRWGHADGVIQLVSP